MFVKQVLGRALAQVGFDLVHPFTGAGQNNAVAQLEARLFADEANRIRPIEAAKEHVPIMLEPQFPEGSAGGFLTGYQDGPVAQVLGDGILLAQAVGFGSEVYGPQPEHGGQDHDPGQHTQRIGQGETDHGFRTDRLRSGAAAVDKVQYASQGGRIVAHAGKDAGGGGRREVETEVGDDNKNGRYDHHANDEEHLSVAIAAELVEETRTISQADGVDE